MSAAEIVSAATSVNSTPTFTEEQQEKVFAAAMSLIAWYAEDPRRQTAVGGDAKKERLRDFDWMKDTFGFTQAELVPLFHCPTAVVKREITRRLQEMDSVEQEA